MVVNNRCLKLLVTTATIALLIAAAVTGEEEPSESNCPTGSPAAQELRLKIDELESKLVEQRKETGKLRFKLYELKRENSKQTEELEKSSEQRTELEKTEKKCRKDLGKAVSDLANSNKENRVSRIAVGRNKDLMMQMEMDMKRMTLELEEARTGSTCGPSGTQTTAPGLPPQDGETLREQLVNCEETVKAVRERCDKDSGDLKRIEKTHERIRKGLENCTEKARACEAEKDHLHFLKKGYDLVVKQLEKDTQDAKDGKEKSESSAKEAIKGASKYQFWLAGVGVLFLIGATVKLYSYVKAKMAERVAALAAARQREKLETKRKGVPLSSKQKKKLS